MLKQLPKLKSKAEVIDLTARFQLRQQLASYGLNSEEWNYEKFEISEDQTAGSATLHHRNDENLKLKGKYERQPFSLKTILKWTWTDLAWDL